MGEEAEPACSAGRQEPRADVLLLEDLGQQHLQARALAAALRRAGLCARLVDYGPGQETGALVRLAARLQPRLVVGSILFADRVREYLALFAALRQADVRAHLTLVGPLPTFASAELLAACTALDSVLRGECDGSIVQLAAALAAPARLEAVPGLAFRSPAPRPSPLPAAVGRLDDLPFPARDGPLPRCGEYAFATVAASRGCYHACAFCLPCALYRAAGAPYRLRSVPNLVDEVEALYRRGVRLFLFDDEQFLPPPALREERVEALGRELARRGLEIAFTIKCRADDVEDRLFRRMQDLGLLRVYVGVESGCPATLHLLRKGLTPERNAVGLAALARLGIVADFRSLLFHPWSTRETVRTEIGFLATVAPHVCACFSFHEVEIYPGTPLADRLWTEGRAAAEPGALPYGLADPSAERLRRLCRFLFGAGSAYAHLQSRVTQVWFELLLARRFRPDTYDPRCAEGVRGVVATANGRVLRVWHEMLALAGESGFPNASLVNERAGAWALDLRQLCAEAEAALVGLAGGHVGEALASSSLAR